MKKYLLTAILLGAISWSSGTAEAQETGPLPQIVAQEQTLTPAEAELMRVLEPLVVKLIRLGIVTAYSDPGLTIQELDRLSPEIERLLAALASDPGKQNEIRLLFAPLEVWRLNTLAEFGLTREFEEKIMPALVNDKETDDHVYSLVNGFRTSLDHGQEVQAKRFLDLCAKAQTDYQGQIDPVNQFVLTSLPTIYRISSGQELTVAERDRLFSDAWKSFAGYSPNENLEKGASWYHGRYVMKFWFSQYLPGGLAASPLFSSKLGEFSGWLTAFNPQIKADPANPYKQLDEARGAIIFLLSAADMLLYPFEESAEFANLAQENGMHGAFDEMFTKVDAISDGLDEVFVQAGYGGTNLKGTSYMESLKVRSKIVYGLDKNQSADNRRKVLLDLPRRVESITTPDLYIAVNMRLGRALLEVGESGQGTEAIKRALERAEQYHYDLLGAQAAGLLAQEYGRQGDIKSATLYGNKVGTSLASGVGTVDRQTLEQETEKLTEDQATALLDSNAPEEALQVLTRGHQLTVASTQVEGNKQARGALADLGKAKSSLQAIEGDLATLKSMPASSTRDALMKRAETLLADGRAAFLTQSRKIRAEFPTLYTSTLKFDPLDLAQIQDTLPADTAVVQYFPTDHRLFFFVVTRGTFRLRTLDFDKVKLDEMALKYVSDLRKISPREDVLARELYQVLVAPVAEDIKASDQVVFIPSGSLNVLPFGALLGEKRLLEEKRLVELAKTTDFLRISGEQPKPIKQAVAFANATLDLPGTEKEGEAVKNLFPGSRLFEGKDASKVNFTQFGAQADVLHLATHGVWDPSDSLKNYLKLSNGEQLRQDEIFDLDLSKTSLVTLSACNTALGDKGDKGDLGFVSSLAEAFWIAGSHSVVASLWAVEDESTQILMQEFYAGLRAGKSRSGALRDAQKQVMSNSRFRHPYYWSGFVLFGDYR